MNINHLKFVREVAKTGSFTEAAKACFVTQPTLSNGIGQLEEALGAKLFERTTRKVSLTPFGEHMLPVMMQMLDARQEIQQTADQFLNPKDHQLTIGFSPLADMRIVKAMVDLYTSNQATEHPVYFKECFMEDLYERLAAEKIALAICPSITDKDNTSNFSSLTLYKEPVFVLNDSEGEASGNNAGTSQTIDFSVDNATVTVDVTGPNPQTLSTVLNSGQLGPGLSQTASPFHRQSPLPPAW